MEEDKNKQVTVQLSPSTLRRIDALKNELQITSRSTFISLCCLHATNCENFQKAMGKEPIKF